MNLSISSIFAGLIFGVIGLWMLKEAKRRANLKLIPISIGLMGYSYFTTSPFYDWLIGIAFCILAYFLWE